MAVRSGKFWRRSGHWLCGTSVVFALFWSLEAQGVTYYVAPTGNDSNPGTLANPWRHPQACVTTRSPLVAGDTCLVLNGTYADTDGDGIVVYARTTAPSGTALKPITIKSETPLGARFVVPSRVDALNAGFRITVPYYIIEGFEIQGSPYTTGNSHHGITLTSGATGTVIRMNSIHDLGRTVCSNTRANSGITFHGVANVVIEHNSFHTIGRLRAGENGCVTIIFHHDHGIYAGETQNLTIRYNIFHDITRGYPIHIYREGGCTNIGLFIYNNVFADRSPTNRPTGQILLAHSLSNVHINNNIFYDPPKGYGIEFYHVGTIKDVVISHNLTNGAASVMINPSGKPSSGLTYAENMFNTHPKVINAEARDFRLTSKSPAIDRGTDVGLPFTGRAPDIGAFEFSEQEGNSPLRPEGLQIR
ncbi:MAG: hypothetical protein Nkreftii_001397 [Candidatus Nitrospira kreftii]|uniref:Right handed beta helix domain-containing protein n=1 Tax=Candidatus Nitrospira kreftii TaxID=2652173 RepID=A0A7S8FD26_9BACT|nr:MAG: hypothetical protein Nkreftii_001397 [Candidatus Nitrospira kreftii]